MDEKNHLRNKYKNIRQKIDVKDKIKSNDIIFKKIINMQKYKNSNLILVYASKEDEVDTIRLINYSLKNNKKVALPKCNENHMDFYYIDSINELKKGSFNILEPITKNMVDDFNNSICVVPGVVFDKNKNRIGYGKGYYDRFLYKYKGMKIGLCYKSCICNNIQTSIYDIKMDKVICD